VSDARKTRRIVEIK